MRKIFTIITITFCFFFAVACGDFIKNTSKTQEDVYLLAVEAGYNGTYEEWLETVKGEKGDSGLDGVSIVSVNKTETNGLIDTYTISYSNGTTSTFTVSNGKDGYIPEIKIGDNGNWYIDDLDTGICAKGQKGDTGFSGKDGNGIKSIELTESNDNIDTYTIYYTNGETSSFTVTNAKKETNIIAKPIEIIEKGDGYVLPSTAIGAKVAFGTFSSYTKYLVPAYVNVTIIMKNGGSYGFARTDKLGNVLEICSNANYSFYTFEALEEASYLYVSDVKVESISDFANLNNSNSYWSGKNIWWCGTSIPAGGYPLLVGEKLGANVFQEAVGGSMARANVSTGDYNGANISNITSSLTMTKEEANEFINNYDTLRQLDKNSSWPETLSDSQKNRILSGTFETKLLPYLEGQKPMPDLFVIDHRHNDWKYRDANGNIDIELEPTVENIKNGLLAEDTYMTANNYENLKKYFGDLSSIPENRFEEFVASINRNCYKGAINFLLTLIMSHNPHARVVFISNYEYENGYNESYSNVIDAQKSLSEEWCFPIFEIYKYLGYSNKIIPGSKEYMSENYPGYNFNEDVTVYEIYNVDKVHPSSDSSGFANEIYAELIAIFLEQIR